MEPTVSCPNCGRPIDLPPPDAMEGGRCESCDLELPHVPHAGRGEVIELEVLGEGMNIPSYCACCLGPNETERRVTGVEASGDGGTTSRWLDFPYCSACDGHVKRRSLQTVLTWLGGSLLGVAAGWFALAAFPWMGPMGLAAALATGALVGGMGTYRLLAHDPGPEHGAPGTSVEMPSFDEDSTTFRFANGRYAAFVMALNECTSMRVEPAPSGKGLAILLALGIAATVALGGWGTWSWNHVGLYVDNGTGDDVEITFAERETVRVPAGDRRLLTLPRTDLEAVTTSGEKDLETVPLPLAAGSGYQVYNVGGTRCYIFDTSVYGASPEAAEGVLDEGDLSVRYHHREAHVDPGDPDHFFEETPDTLETESSTATRTSFRALSPCTFCQQGGCRGNCAPGAGNACSCTHWGQCGMETCRQE